MSKHYIGLDVSLTSTGIVFMNEQGDLARNGIGLLCKVVNSEPVKEKKQKPGDSPIWVKQSERKVAVVKAIDLFLRNCHPGSVIAVEGYGYQLNASIEPIVELGGLVRVLLTGFYKQGLEVIWVAPSTLKKHATGRGNATKPLMIAAAQDRGIDFSAMIDPSKKQKYDDLADAYWLADFARMNDLERLQGNETEST